MPWGIHGRFSLEKRETLYCQIYTLLLQFALFFLGQYESYSMILSFCHIAFL